MGTFLRFFALLATSAALPFTAAQAYLDGASVSIAFQAIVGLTAAYIVTGRAYLQKIKNLFSRSKDGETGSGETNS